MISLIKNIFRNRGFVTAQINGFTLGTYDPHKAGLWKRMRGGAFEAEETKLLEEVLPKCNAFIDVGAHIGYYSCLAHYVNNNLQIVAFEPNKKNYKSLVKNFEINGIPVNSAFNMGIGRERKIASLYGGDSAGTINATAHTVLPKGKQQVEVDKLDNFTFFVEDRVFIKIDVEACEYEVLLGAENFIKEVKPVGMLIEINEYWDAGRNPYYEKTFELMDQLGYVKNRVGENWYFTIKPACFSKQASI